jgi:acetyl esterase/lipase
MRIGRRGIFGLGLAAFSGGAAMAAQNPPAAQNPTAPPSPTPSAPVGEHIPLWPFRLPERAPAGLVERMDGGVIGVAQPRIEVFRPLPGMDQKRAILVIPGGGYQRLVLDNEGYGMARYLTGHGITACVLVHRLPGEGWAQGAQAPLQDAQRAMKVIRSQATRWGVDTAHVGVIGFSAGGHLAGMLSTHFRTSTYPATDGIDALPSRPAYAGLIYPVIGMESEMNHGASRRMLIGDNPTPEQMRAFSVDKHVTPETPTTFIACAADDPIVPAENSQRMFRALQTARVRSELHVFESGGHGFGLVSKTTAGAWPDLFMRWRPEG